MTDSVMEVKQLKDILKKYKDGDIVSLYCHNDKAKLRVCYGKNQKLKKVIMEERDWTNDWV